MMVSILVASCSCGGGVERAADTGGDAAYAAGLNACGGADPLIYQGQAAAPADACGPCFDGVLVCATANLLACAGARAASSCADSSAGTEDATTESGPIDAAIADTTTGPSTSDGASGPPPTDGAITVGDALIDAPTEASSGPPYDGGAGWELVTDAGVAVTTLTDGGFPSVQCIALATSDLVLDSTRTVLYASVMSTSPVFGNSVVRIDPSTVAVTGTVLAGSNPDALALSDDATSLYVGLDGSASVLRIDPVTGYLDAPVYLGASQNEGPRTAGEILAVPGSSTQYVVSRRVAGVSPSFAGLALYDGATLLGEWNGFVGGESIAFVSPSILYGYNNEDTGFDLFEFSVGATGITEMADTMGVVTGFSTTIAAQDGWVFATNGVAVNGSNMEPAGQYAASGPVWPSTDETDVWFLTSGPTLVDFDRATFLQTLSISLPAGAGGGSPQSLLGWSSASFVFRTPSSVCIVSISP